MIFYRALFFKKDSQVAFHVTTLDTLHFWLRPVAASAHLQICKHEKNNEVFLWK